MKLDREWLRKNNPALLEKLEAMGVWFPGELPADDDLDSMTHEQAQAVLADLAHARPIERRAFLHFTTHVQRCEECGKGIRAIRAGKPSFMEQMITVTFDPWRGGFRIELGRAPAVDRRALAPWLRILVADDDRILGMESYSGGYGGLRLAALTTGAEWPTSQSYWRLDDLSEEPRDVRVEHDDHLLHLWFSDSWPSPPSEWIETPFVEYGVTLWSLGDFASFRPVSQDGRSEPAPVICGVRFNKRRLVNEALTRIRFRMDDFK